jgi:hypothetical protein
MLFYGVVMQWCCYQWGCDKMFRYCPEKWGSSLTFMIAALEHQASIA